MWVFKSLYLKWLLGFIFMLFVAQAVTVVVYVRTIVNESSDALSDRLYRKAQAIRDLHAQGIEIKDGTLYALGDTDIILTFLSPEIQDEHTIFINLDMVNRARRGEIVTSARDHPLYKMPYCLFMLDDYLVLLNPIMPHNQLSLFVHGITNAMMFNIMLSSLFVSLALLLVIHKIRRLTWATREIAKGNFDVRLKPGADDEAGELIRNFNFMAQELKKSDYLKKDFASTVSHEFKTPITAIEGFAKLLKTENLTPEQFREYTDIIIKETSRLSNLSTNLLRLSVLDNSDYEPAQSPFYMDEQLRSVILLLERQWEEKGISFEIDMDEILYNGNEELLSQVWINILQNAIKFSSTSGVIFVSLKAEGHNVTVKISDKGIGIAEQHIEKIFTRFYKADSQRAKDGNGLGLAIAKRIVELCRGEIGVESEKGRGSTFFVKLPKT